jgi:hypothetical protein
LRQKKKVSFKVAKISNTAIMIWIQKIWDILWGTISFTSKVDQRCACFNMYIFWLIHSWSWIISNTILLSKNRENKRNIFDFFIINLRTIPFLASSDIKMSHDRCKHVLSQSHQPNGIAIVSCVSMFKMVKEKTS